MISREVNEGEQLQGEDERIAYTIDTTPWGGTPTGAAVVAKDVTNSFAVVTATVLPSGSPSVNGNVITLPLLQSLTRGHIYRIEVAFTSGGNNLESYFIVKAER